MNFGLRCRGSPGCLRWSKSGLFPAQKHWKPPEKGQQAKDQATLLSMMSQSRCFASSTIDEQMASPSASTSAGKAPMAMPPARQGKLQTFDFSMLAACVAELKQHWVPAKVDQIVQSDTATLCMLLRNEAALEDRRDRKWLYLSWQQAHARVSLGPPPERGSSSEAFSLANQMQSTLRGLVLLDVKIPMQWERVVEFEFGPRLQECSHRVYLEIMGKYSNLILTDSQQRIEACGRQISDKMSSKRSLQTGQQYELPPAKNAVAPSALEPLSNWKQHILEGLGKGEKIDSLATAMCRAYKGMSPAMAKAICSKAGQTSSEDPQALSRNTWRALHVEWSSWVHSIETGSFSPTAAPPPDGSVSVIGLHDGTSGSALGLIDEYYRMPEEEDVFGKLMSRVGGAVTKGIKRLHNKQHALRQQLDQVGQAEKNQKLGDLIVANLYKYERGADSLTVEDWEAEKEIVIPLDPSVPALEQAEGLFKKARKLRRTSENVEPLLHQSEEEVAYLQEIQSQLDALEPGDPSDLHALREIEEELVQRQICKPAADSALAAKGASKARKAKKKSGSAGPDFRTFESPSGFQVLVGRNNVQNDELTHRVANDSDLWFHARGWPGSHTVLRIPSGKREVEADLQFAANAAAFFSKARSEGRAEVVYALVKDLKKPKGARPGQVLVTKERVIAARPSACPAAGKNQ